MMSSAWQGEDSLQDVIVGMEIGWFIDEFVHGHWAFPRIGIGMDDNDDCELAACLVEYNVLSEFLPVQSPSICTEGIKHFPLYLGHLLVVILI